MTKNGEPNKHKTVHTSAIDSASQLVQYTAQLYNKSQVFSLAQFPLLPPFFFFFVQVCCVFRLICHFSFQTEKYLNENSFFFFFF